MNTAIIEQARSFMTGDDLLLGGDACVSCGLPRANTPISKAMGSTFNAFGLLLNDSRFICPQCMELFWELTQTREVAAEHISGSNGQIRHARVGLLVDSRAVIKTYPGDVWSVTEGDKLKATRYASGWELKNRQHEAFCKPVYRAIVVKEHPDRMKPVVMAAVREAAQRHNLPVMWVDGKGKKHSV